jgi:hypothetical protein
MGIGNEWNDVFRPARKPDRRKRHISKARYQPLLLDKFSSLARCAANDVTLDTRARA